MRKRGVEFIFYGLIGFAIGVLLTTLVYEFIQ